MSPRYVPIEVRAEIRRLLETKWDTGEWTLEQIAENQGVSLGTVGGENLVRLGGMEQLKEAHERRKAAGAKPGPKPGSPRHPNSISDGRPREIDEQRVFGLSDQGLSLRKIASKIAQEMGREKVSAEAIRKILQRRPAS